MEFGVTFPQTDIELDPDGIRSYGETVDSLGYEHILAYDHILGVEPPSPDWDGPYDYTDQFLEPFVLFSQLATVTDAVDFLTGVLVLPQRETALVAKQAATLDALTDGRFVLGAGVGWNEREYRNLGVDFGTRGTRVVEQIALLKRLWANDLVEFEGEYHQVENAGINPRPDGDTIPVWLGGGADVVLRRIARRADGWLAPTVPLSELESKVKTLRTYLEDEGRDPGEVAIHARVKLGDDSPDRCLEQVTRFDEVGVSHVGVGTMNMGLRSSADHLDVLADFMTDLRDTGLA